MKRTLWMLLAGGALLCAANREGLKPRAAPEDYVAQGAAGPVRIGASVLSPDQVRNTFSTDLNRGWVVVELGVYPEQGTKLDLGPGDFMLRVSGRDEAVRPAGPKAIAAILQGDKSRDREITLHPTVGVGYESGGYDPYYGRRGGWTTGVGVGVGVGRDQTASSPADRKAMELELGEQQLPEEIVTGPVAGYLYFPVKPGAKNVEYTLEYMSAAGKTTLPLRRK